MGGNALKLVKTRRYNKDEYDLLKTKIIDTLRSHEIFKGRKIQDIQAYKEKETFGDMDLLISSNNLPNNTWDIVKELFHPQQLVRNSSVTSFDVNELQIDMILSPDHEYDITAIYFSYNDLGNLMGRVAYKIGFKYGHAGLAYMIRDENHVIDEINISMDPNEIFNFLGYDFNTYKKGFNNLEDIFNYTITTPLFNKDYYNLETRNYASRIRDRKRSTYSGFLKWIETKDELPNYDYIDKKEFHLKRAFELFPKFKLDYESSKAKYKKTMECKSKFSGKLVTDLTHLTGDKLGQWIQGFKKSKPDFETWLLNTTDTEINETIINTFKNGSIELREKEKPIYGRDSVRDVTGFDGRKLTMFMNDFKQKWPSIDSFQQWVQETDTTEIKSTIKTAADSFNYDL